MPCPEFVKLHMARRPCFPDRSNGRLLLVVAQFLVKLEKRRQASPKMLFNLEKANCQKNSQGISQMDEIRKIAYSNQTIKVQLIWTSW